MVELVIAFLTGRYGNKTQCDIMMHYYIKLSCKAKLNVGLFFFRFRKSIFNKKIKFFRCKLQLF